MGLHDAAAIEPAVAAFARDANGGLLMTAGPFGGGLTVGEIADVTGAQPRNGTALDQLIISIAPLDLAGHSDPSITPRGSSTASLSIQGR